MNVVEAIKKLSSLPNKDRGKWLESSEDGVSFLKESSSGEEIVIYASAPHVYVHGVLAHANLVTPPDKQDLLGSQVMVDDAWCIQRVSGGDEGHRISLEPPLSSPGCKSLAGGEKLVFVRSLPGVHKGPAPIELSQKLVHSLDLHYLRERNAYCRLDGRGDIEDVIKIQRVEANTRWDDISVVTILPKELCSYMTLSNTVLVRRFYFTRFAPGGFDGWPSGDEKYYDAPDLFYRSKNVHGHASYTNGCILLRSALSVSDLVDEWKEEEFDKNKKYGTFKIIDRKNQRLLETSCGPEFLSNYFQDSDLPWEISPAFFHPEVLQRYKADPEKYSMDDRSINCRGAWYLKTYDINEAGQVHTYIGYLADLPYEEQVYWQSFNEWPKANISERAYRTDILGEWYTEYDALNSLKEKIRKLDLGPPVWWKRRGEEMLNAVRYPSTDSTSEWGSEILSLDHLIVEAFLEKPIRKIVEVNGGQTEKDWRSLKLLEVALISLGRTEDQAAKIVAPLRELRSLRNPAKAHGDPKGKQEAVSSAREKYGTLRSHFTALASRIDKALERITQTLPS